MSLDGGEVISLTRNECPCYGAPHLWGREVVYESTRGWHDIWLVNIDTLEERNLNDDRVEQWTPAFDGRWVVWSDGRNDPCSLPSWDLCNTDIYGMAMPDGEIEPLCDHPAVQTHPDVHLGLVAWEDFRNAEDPNDGNARDANIDIYLLDLDTRREVQVTNLPGPERMPRIWGRRLFYVAEDLIGQQAIFMIDLDEAGLL
jgi:Tol biopolymer transport system component